jgi:DNA-binding NtrC family response regulator
VSVEAKAVVLIVHEERGVIETLRALFEARGCVVEEHDRAEPAIRRLATGDVAVVVIGWEGEVGRRVYGWATRHRRDLRRRFIALRRELPQHHREAAARRRVFGVDDLATLLDVADRIISAPRPRLLLVDDDPTQLAEMALLLQGAGFEVTATSGIGAAVAHLDRAEVDLVLSDWRLADGNGEDLHRWIAESRPTLLPQLCFITGGNVEDARKRVNGIAVMPKGQDSPTLLRQLDRSLGKARFARGTPPQGTVLPKPSGAKKPRH